MHISLLIFYLNTEKQLTFTYNIINQMVIQRHIALLITFFSFVFVGFSQEKNEGYDLYVAFDLSYDFQTSNTYNEVISSKIIEFDKIEKEYHIILSKGILISDEKIEAMSKSAIAITGNDISVRKLKNIVKVTIENPTVERVNNLANIFKTFKGVEYVNLMSTTPIKPPGDIAPVTPDYEPNQTYIEVNPGVNMRYAWNLGQIGSGINIRDVEYGFNKNHEELVDRNAFVFPGMTISSSATTAYTEHGTAVIGILYADKGSYGISGMAYGANEIYLFPEWQQTGYNRVNAVTKSIENSAPGDIIVFEMQTYGNDASDPNDFVPAEYDATVWSLTKAATDSGIIIVAAGGNGNQDLDNVSYNNYSTRGNSGAILVGAGTPDLAHDKISYSTYGSRIDVQGWAQNVRSSGYGDFTSIGGDFNQGYTNFSGTSSATPIVASCAVVLQSYYFSLTGSYLTPIQMRNLLYETGIPQGAGGNIGPLPDMQSAMTQIMNDLGTDDFIGNQFLVYPNPVQDKMIVFLNNHLVDPKIEIYSGMGQLLKVSKVNAGENTIDMSGFSKGFYFVKLSDGNKVATKKVIKY